MKTVDLICETCKTPFQKEKKEFDRQIRKGKDKFYCCISCSATNNRLDEFSRFRKIYRNCIKRANKTSRKSFKLTLPILKQIWESQNGICPYTNKKMVLNTKEHVPHAASLDRIDSLGGYTKDNVEFVCMFINLGKSDFTKSQIKEFLGQ